jgi:hypothetical protein
MKMNFLAASQDELTRALASLVDQDLDLAQEQWDMLGFIDDHAF